MEAQTRSPMQETLDYSTAAALRHAAECIEELVDAGEPMGPRQTFRRGYNAADDYLLDTVLTGDDFEAAADQAGDVAALAQKHGIAGKDAAEFYRNKADALEQ